MWFDRLHIDGFGLYDDRELRFRSDRVNLFLDDNQRGKTTLLHALLAALYGLHEVKGGRRYGLPEEDRFRPWHAEGFGLESSIVVGERELLVRRNLEDREVEVFEDGEERTGEFRRGKARIAFGETLTGLPRSLFLKTFCVTHEGLDKGDFDDLAEPVEQALGTRSGETTAEDALRVLRHALDNLGADTVPVKGARKADLTVSKLASLLEELREEQEELRAEQQEREAERAALMEETADPAELAGTIRRVQLRRDLAALEEARRDLAEAEKIQGQIDEARGRLEGLEEDRRRPVRREDLEALREATGRIETSARALEENEASLAEAEERLGDLERRLAELTDGPPPSEEDVEALHQALTLARREASSLTAARSEALEAENELRAKDDDVDGALARHAAFAAIPDQHDFLHEIASRIGNPVAEARERLVAARERRTEGVWLRLAGLALFAAPLAVGLWWVLTEATLERVVLGTALAALGGLLCVALLVHWARSDRRARSAVREAREHLEQEETADAVRRDRLESIAERTGISPEKLPREWRWFATRRADVQELLHEREQEKEALEALAALATEHRTRIERFVEIEATEPCLEDYETAHAAAKEGLELAREAERIREEIETTRRKIEHRREEKASTRRKARRLCEEAGVAVDPEAPSSWNAAMREALERKEEAIQLAEEKIPAWDERLERLRASEPRARIARLEEIVASSADGEIEVDPDSIEGGSDDYDEELRRLRERKAEAEEALEGFERGVAGEEETFRRRWDELLVEIDETEHKLARARDFRDTVALALEEMEAISRDSYRLWSKELNPRVEERVRRLLPEAKSFRFDPDMGWRLELDDGTLHTHEELGRLSEGAQGRMLLAVRLGLADYLSEASPDHCLPLLLDDPFVNFDDESFRTAFRALLDQAREGRQVFLFTCHGVRHRHLEEVLGQELARGIHFIRPFEPEIRAASSGESPA